MIDRRQIISGSAGPIFAIFAPCDRYLFRYFVRRWPIWTSFLDSSRDVAMATK